ncbi:hypothetical protein GCM10029963_70450 [Micromonospora andamanensis]
MIDSNEFWDNGLDGIRVDRPMIDAAVTNNRIRSNGRQCAPAATGSGESVRYARRAVSDRAAVWQPDGHRGKLLRVGSRQALVVGNTEMELDLADLRPDAAIAWNEDVPPPGASYELPAAAPVRAGIVVNAHFESATVRGNRIWDSREDRTQSYGLWISDQGVCVSCRVEDNDLAGNAEGRCASTANRSAAAGTATTPKWTD